MKPRGPSEAEIQSAADDLLMLDGWRIIKTDLPHLRGLGVQEKGMPDRLYIRYAHVLAPRDPENERIICHMPTPYTEALWIEWKKRGGKSAQHQKHWHRYERARGALVIVAGEDFPASVDGFLGWYRQSGLAWRELKLKFPWQRLGEILAESLAKAKEP